MSKHRPMLMAVLTCLIVLGGCTRAVRPPGVPAGVKAMAPWGSVTSAQTLDPAKQHGQRPEVLVISGGGSNIAYTAGLISGWSKAGTRPDFDTVTGISAGALVSTFVFLGKDYDKELRDSIINLKNSDVFVEHSLLSALFGDSLAETSPLKMRLDKMITERLLDKVANKHRRGYRLFIGSTNLDREHLVIWNLGAIAASNHPQRLEVYKKAILASASVPVKFNPTFIEVKAEDGKSYHEMHVDGGVTENFLLRDYMVPQKGQEGRVYLIRNGLSEARKLRGPVKPSLISIAVSTFETLYNQTVDLIIERDFGDLKRLGYQHYLYTAIAPTIAAAIKKQTGKTLSFIDFDPEVIRLLFEAGYGEGAHNRIPWVRMSAEPS